MDWITNIFAFIAIVISIFSLLSARRNTNASERSAKAAERSAIAAEQSTEAAIESNYYIRARMDSDTKKELERHNSLRSLYIKRLVASAREIHKAVLGKYQVESPFANKPFNIDWESIRSIQMDIIFPDEVLIDYFSAEEREQIVRAWKVLNNLIDTYGIDDEKREGFRLADTVISEFHHLLRMFKKC